MPSNRTLRIGTRASKLARWQSDWVAAELVARGVAVEVVEIATRGDLEQLGPVAGIGTTGVFTKEIQAALLAGAVDVAVHSLKDLPTQQVPGLALAAVPPRENPADALLAANDASLANLPHGARVGTGSARRCAQLLHLRPDLQMLPIRGNVDTRIRKLDAGDYDAIVLAAAGLVRLGLHERIAELLAPPRMLPAPGQGALAIECRSDDDDAWQVVATLDDPAARLAVTAEREVLAALEGGCSAPIAAWGRLDGDVLRLEALVASVDGSQVLRAAASHTVGTCVGAGAVAAAAELGRRVAQDLAAQGASELVGEARGS